MLTSVLKFTVLSVDLTDRVLNRTQTREFCFQLGDSLCVLNVSDFQQVKVMSLSRKLFLVAL